MLDRHGTLKDPDGLDVQYRVYRGFEIDLTDDEDELFSNMTSACRRCIRKAEKEGVIIEEAHDLGFADGHYAQLKDVLAKQRLLPTYGIERVRQLITLVHLTGHLLLLCARDQSGRCIATGIFPHMSGVMYFGGSANWRQHQGLRPNESIQWYAMKIAKQNDVHAYDMGGGGDNKRKYGGREIEVPWFRKSKYPWIGRMRSLAQRSHSAGRRCMGAVQHLLERGGPEGVLSTM